MKRIRIGNDFVFNWAIERGGLPENLESVLEAELTASVFCKKQEVPFTVSGNIITVEFTPEICNITGSYNLLFTYILPDTSLSDEERKCAVDVDAFRIVAKTAQADDSTEFSMTSDMAIALRGKSAYEIALEEGFAGTKEDWLLSLKGDDGTMSFEELTPEQKAELKGDKGDKGDPFEFNDLTPEQKAELKGEKGDKGDPFEFNDLTPEQKAELKGDKGDKGDPFEFNDLTPEQKAELKGDKGDKGDPFEFNDLTPEQKAELKGDKGDKGDPFEFNDLTPEQKAELKGEKGDKGDPNTLSIGTVQGGTNAVATITGTAPNQILNLTLPKGDTGSNIELQKTTTHVQWRVVGGAWVDLIPLSDLKGEQGDNISLQKTATHIQWRLGTGAWTDLVALTELKGDKGDTGDKGWTPLYAEEADGNRIVRKLTDYIGGEGAKPTANVGQYLKSDGTFTSIISEAMDVRVTGGTLPAGGTTGQALVKKSATDFDVEWKDGGGGGSQLLGRVELITNPSWDASKISIDTATGTLTITDGNTLKDNDVVVFVSKSLTDNHTALPKVFFNFPYYVTEKNGNSFKIKEYEGDAISIASVGTSTDWYLEHRKITRIDVSGLSLKKARVKAFIKSAGNANNDWALTSYYNINADVGGMPAGPILLQKPAGQISKWSVIEGEIEVIDNRIVGTFGVSGLLISKSVSPTLTFFSEKAVKLTTLDREYLTAFGIGIYAAPLNGSYIEIYKL